jgi:hypothetical protein
MTAQLRDISKTLKTFKVAIMFHCDDFYSWVETKKVLGKEKVLSF